MKDKLPGKIRDLRLMPNDKTGTTVSFKRPNKLKGDELWSFQWKKPTGSWTGLSWMVPGMPKTAIPPSPFRIKHIFENDYMAFRMVLTNQYGQTYSNYIWVGKNCPKNPPKRIYKAKLAAKRKAMEGASKNMSYHNKMMADFRTRHIKVPQVAHAKAMAFWQKVFDHHRSAIRFMQQTDRDCVADVVLINRAQEASDHAKSVESQPKPVMPKGWQKIHGWQWKLWARTWDKDDHRVPYLTIRPKWSHIYKFIYGFPKRKDLPRMIRSIHLHVPWMPNGDVNPPYSITGGGILQPEFTGHALINEGITCYVDSVFIQFDIP